MPCPVPWVRQMRRREFIAALGNAAAWPLFARAQQQAVPVIGLLSGGFQEAAAPVVAAIKQGLLDAGYVEGKNVAIEYRWANAQYDQLPTLAADLVRQRVSVIIAETPVAALAAKHATTSIPIVFSLGSDPVRDGLVASLNRPGGNITGATFLSNLLSAKRLDLFQRFVPDAKVIAVLLNPKNANVELETRDTQEAAGPLGLQLVLLRAGDEREIDEAVASSVQQHVDALVISGDATFYGRRQQIAELAIRYKLPTCCPYHDQAAAGCLMTYGGASISDTQRQAGKYAGRILKGERSADLPVLQPTKFELAINRKTAKGLGLTIPPSLLATADEIID